MARFVAMILGLVFACPILARAEDNQRMDLVTQKVLSQYGVDSKILRSCDQLKETSSRKDGRFYFNFEGSPGIRVLLDRDYWVLVTLSTKKDNDVVGYLLNPEDGQSALNISIGNDLQDKPDAALSKEPGFSGITSGDGAVGGQKVIWRQWSDQEHLHSDCTLLLPVRDGKDQPARKVNIEITANTKERRSALEDCLATLKLQYSKR